MGDARVEVIPIPNPAILVFHNIEFASYDPDVDADTLMMETIKAELVRIAGHDNILILRTYDDGQVILITESADALALVEAAARLTQGGTNGHEE